MYGLWGQSQSRSCSFWLTELLVGHQRLGGVAGGGGSGLPQGPQAPVDMAIGGKRATEG